MAKPPIKLFLPEWKTKCLAKLEKHGAKTKLAKKLQELYSTEEESKPLRYWTKLVNDILHSDRNVSGEYVLAIANLLKVR